MSIGLLQSPEQNAIIGNKEALEFAEGLQGCRSFSNRVFRVVTEKIGK